VLTLAVVCGLDLVGFEDQVLGLGLGATGFVHIIVMMIMMIKMIIISTQSRLSGHIWAKQEIHRKRRTYRLLKFGRIVEKTMNLRS